MLIRPLPQTTLFDFAAIKESSLPHVLISIVPDGCIMPEDYENIKNNFPCSGILRMDFDDRGYESDDSDGCVLFTPKHAQQVLKFINIHIKKIQVILVNCEAGFSRSPGVSAALSLIINKSNDHYFKKYCPNRLVYITLLQEYYKNQELYSNITEASCV